MDKPITHLAIVRVCDSDPEGANIQVRSGHVDAPTEHGLTEIRAHAMGLFRRSFGREPARVGVAILPWVGELDDDGDR